MVIFFREQVLSPAQHLAFGRLFGELHIHPAAPHEPGMPELMIIHTDRNSPVPTAKAGIPTSPATQSRPWAPSCISGSAPPNGGDTLFASMYAAYEALSDRLKAYLDGLTAVHDGEHVYRGLFASIGEPDRPTYPQAEHPVVRTHPVTGRKALYVNRGSRPASPASPSTRATRSSATCTSTWKIPCSSAASAGAPTRSRSGTIAAPSTARCGTTGRIRGSATASR